MLGMVMNGKGRWVRAGMGIDHEEGQHVGVLLDLSVS